MGPQLDFTVAGALSLACIDLSNSDEAALAKLVREACTKVGFFYVINHGLDDEMAEVFKQSKKFFDLPVEEKMKSAYDKNPNYRGYTPYLSERLGGRKQTDADLKEGYYMSEDISPNDVRSRLPLHGPNVWPSPDILPGWKEAMETYREEMLKLVKRIMRLIALALDLDVGYFDKPSKADRPDVVLRLLKYSAEKSRPEEGVFAAGPHTDWGMMTLLATDDVPGLQLCTDKDAVPQAWTDVPPIKGGFVVNLGQMLERWSNNVFRSTLHRVVNAGQVRYSVAAFVVPNYNCVVKCLPTCRGAKGEAPKYPPCVVVERILELYKATQQVAEVA